MSSASGTSVKGNQVLLIDTDTVTNVSLYLDGVDPAVAKYQGYISFAINNNVSVYQVAGMPLWYQGVWFPIPVGSGYRYAVIAAWRYAGLLWHLDTF